MALSSISFLPSVGFASSEVDAKVRRLAKQARTATKTVCTSRRRANFQRHLSLVERQITSMMRRLAFSRASVGTNVWALWGGIWSWHGFREERRARNARDNCEARRMKSQTLRIETNPSLANVRLGNQKNPIVGTTPLELKRPPGVLRVFIEKEGYEPVIRDVELQSGNPFLLSVELKEIVSTGYLFVDATVSGGKVFLNGKSSRLTPFESPLSLQSGVYQYTLAVQGLKPRFIRSMFNP